MNCLHPVRISDPKHLERKILVPCGKCELCLKRRADTWNDRLRIEASQHKYCFFVTLTYSDDFVPRFRTEEVLEYPFFTDKQREDTYNYVTTHDVSECYLVLRYRDIQLFLKRLREYIRNDKNCSKEESYIRFACVGEYGETTYRPHYHVIFYVDSDYLAKPQLEPYAGRREYSRISPFEDYIYKAWSVEDKDSSQTGNVCRSPIGRIDVQGVRSEACRYVSNYVTSYSYIPSLLRSSAFRPFIVASRRPSIGSFAFDKEKAKKIIVDGFPTFVNEFGNEYDKNRFVRLWRSLQDRLFPKLPNYASLDVFSRRSLYGMSYTISEDSFEGFRKCLASYYDSYGAFTAMNDVYNLFDDIRLSLKLDSFDALLTCAPGTTLYNSFHRLWCTSRLFCCNCTSYGFKVNDYVDYIDSYYSNNALDGLRAQLRFEQKFSLSEDIRYLVSFIDPLCRENLSVDSYKRVLASFGFDVVDNEDLTKYNFYSVPKYTAMYEKDIVFIDIGKSYKRKMDYVINQHSLSNFNVK